MRRESLAAGSALLVALLLVLLSGLPQLGISFMELDFGGKSFRQLPVTRSLLLDKLLPSKTDLTPPKAAHTPLLSTTRPTMPVLDEGPTAFQMDVPQPSQWQRHLVSRLYRHNSSYI